MGKQLRAFSMLAVLAGVPVTGCVGLGAGRPAGTFLVIGHRGAPAEEAENTLPSFARAVELGATAIETDVCLTSDAHFVLWHDRDPDDAVALLRQVGVEGLAYVPDVPDVGSEWRRPVRMLTLDELRTWYGYSTLFGARDLQARIPTLEELFAWAETAPALRAVYLDLKLGADELDAARAVVGAVDGLMAGHAALADRTIYFLTVEPDVAVALSAAVAGAKFDLRVARDFEGAGALYESEGLGLRDVSTGYTVGRTWPGFVDEVDALIAARDAGRLDTVTVWTFDGTDDWGDLLTRGVDGIMTNDPAALARFRDAAF
jgi:glycerophosphoryl diester phosphodiesterase